MKDDLCGVCNQVEPPLGKKRRKAAKQKKTSDDEIGWIGCDACQMWFHILRVRISNALLPEITNYVYLCEKCTVIGSLTRVAPDSSNKSELGMYLNCGSG